MHTFMIASVSADGFIGRSTTESSKRWTSKEDLQFFKERTKRAKACVVGYTTFTTFARVLPDRVFYVLTRDPAKLASFDPAVVRPVNCSPAELVSQVKADGFSELAVCGGASVYQQYLAAGVVDTLYLSYEPIVFGAGIPLFGKPLEQQLTLTDLTKLNNNTVLHEYAVVRGNQA